MSGPDPRKLGLFVAGLLVLSALPVWLKGGLYLTNFEGDALHLADIVLRMADGQHPHLDFMTPVGALAFWPIVVLYGVGLELGHAFALAQSVLAALVAPVIWWVAVSRLPKVTAYLFAAASVAVMTSLAHGHHTANVAVSMHYNRWAWVLAFAAVLIAVLPARGRSRPRLDGVLLAVLFCAMAFLKITYVAALAPVLVLILAARGERSVLVSGAAAGVILAGAAMIVPGFASVSAYVADLSAAVAAPLRAMPGVDFTAILLSPAFLAPTVILFGCGLYLRRAGYPAEGLAFLLLLPAFAFITWQNFGNDPLWLIPAAALMAALYADGSPKPRLLGATAVMLAALAVPPIVVHGGSGMRLLTIDTSEYTPLVPGREGLGDVYLATRPAQLVRARTVLNDPGGAFADVPVDRPEPVRIAGETLAECQILTGIKATMEVLAGDLSQDETPVFVVDIVSSHWLFGGSPLKGAAPWNYGTLHGLESAVHVLVPLCPVSAGTRLVTLRLLEASDVSLSVVRRTPRFLLLKAD